MDDFFLFLEEKGQNYKNITYKNVKEAFDKISHLKRPYVIHIIGTNGKGSTGRYIASFIYQNKKNVLHYSSPHILKLNERIWLNGDDIDDVLLQKTHEEVYQILGGKLSKKLTYFEYLTILALYLAKDVDFLVLEAGLGGEFDATNVIENNLSVVTSIGLDHQEFLGDNLTKIASTKLKSIDNLYIMSQNQPFEVNQVKDKLLSSKREIEFENFYIKNNLPSYLQKNLLLALNVIKYLNLDTKNLKIPKIKARFEKINNFIFDVGHNELAAKEILKELFGKKINLIYNTSKDKDYVKILNILKPIIKKILILKIDDERILDVKILQNVLNELDIEYDYFDKSKLNKTETFLVFGSFKVVEKIFNELEVED